MKFTSQLTPERRAEMLNPSAEPLRVLIDTDTANEIDDQFALTWALLAPERLEVEAVVAEPFSFQHHRPELLAAAAAMDADPSAPVSPDLRSWVTNLREAGRDPAEVVFVPPDEGMERSLAEIKRVIELIGLPSEGKVAAGSTRYLPDADTPVESEAATRIIERALADDERPLYIVAIGAVTNLASALLMAPEIADRIVITWTSGFPTWAPFSNQPSLNLVQDVAASRILFECGAPMVYLPGYHIGAQLRISQPELDTWFRGEGAIGDYLVHLYENNPLHTMHAVTPYPGQSWVLWDLINVAWLLNPNWVPSSPQPAAQLDDDLYWRPVDGAAPLMEAHAIDRDAIFRDLIERLQRREAIVADHPWITG